jgi:uncharacterized protein (DUF2249 family)
VNSTLNLMAHDLKRTAEKRTLDLWFRLPPRFRHLLVMSELGHLTSHDPRLHSREVPTITVEEFAEAMRFEEAAA